MGNSNSIITYPKKSSEKFYEGDQLKDILYNVDKNYIFIKSIVRKASKNEVKKYKLMYKEARLLFIVLRDDLGNIHNRCINYYDDIYAQDYYDISAINGIISRQFVKNDYELAKKNKIFNIKEIKEYVDQQFLVIDGIFDVGDAVYSRVKKQFGIVTDVLENGKVKISLIYDIPEGNENLPCAEIIKN